MAVHCTTIERVKERVGQLRDDTADASLLARWIPAVSASIEAYLGRKLAQIERTEILSPRENARIVQLSAYPVISISLVEDDPDGIFNGTGLVIGSSFYGLNAERGRLNFSSWPLGGGPDSLKVVYVGGMAETTDAMILSWPAVATAAETQIAHQYRRRSSDGFSNVGGSQTGTAGVQGEVIELVPGVRAILDPFRNLSL